MGKTNYQTANQRLALLCIFSEPHDSSHRGSWALATRLTQHLLFIVQTSDKQTEIEFQMNANELYPIVKPTIIVGICGQTGLVT